MTIVEDRPVDLPTPFGPMRTYVLRPAGGGKFPGVVFFSEIFQVTEPVRRSAAVLAGHGYVVAIPEIFHELMDKPGVILPYDKPGADRGNHCKISKELAGYDADAHACFDFLSAHPACNGRAGAMGICIGGHLALRASFDARCAAAACFYATDIHKRSLGKGMRDDSMDRMGEITGELLMIWGRQDPHIPAEGRRAIYDALTSAGANFTWHEFNAQHAFMRDEGHRYDPELAATCWRLVLDLFSRRLALGIDEAVGADQSGC